jgi:co-chaperonin GroES (HSP10)
MARAVLCALLAAVFSLCAMAQSTPPAAKAVGEIKSRNGGSLVLATDEGKSVAVTLGDGAKVVRIPPGATDLKTATPITAQELQVGDRVLVRGTASDDGRSMTAAAVIVMKQSDVAAKQQQEREDWQKRGIGGLVSSVDPAAGTVTISVASLAGSKKVEIKTTRKTVVRRYAQNSVKFDDAKASNLSQIHPGDQLRARGTKNEDGTEFAAEEIVTGTFRNIAGTVSSVNAAEHSLTVMDLLTKQTVVVNVAADSQLRKLPAMMAQGIAMRLKGQGQGASANGSPSAVAETPRPAATAPQAGGPPQNGGAPGGGQGRPGGGRGDLQQVLSRLPAVPLTDFQKGEAVILVSTEGTDSGVTAITMVGGVEPILTAAPSSQAMMLSPWSLSSGPGESQ